MLRAKSASKSKLNISETKNIKAKKGDPSPPKRSSSSGPAVKPTPIESQKPSVAGKVVKKSTSAAIKSPPEDKRFSIRKPSLLSLKSNVTPRQKDLSPVKPLSARASSTKNANPASRLVKSNSTMSKHSLQHFSKTSKIPQKVENDKFKAFNVLKTKLRDSQSQFFKALGNIKDSYPDKLGEDFKFVVVIKNGEGKLLVNDNKDALKVPSVVKNKNLTSIKANLDLINDEMSSVTGEISKQIQILGDSEDYLKLKEDLKVLQNKIDGMSSVNKTRISEVTKSLEELADSTIEAIKEIDYEDLKSKLNVATDDLGTTKRKLEITETILSELRAREQTRKSEVEETYKQKDNQLAQKEAELHKIRKSVEDQKQKSNIEATKLKARIKTLETELASLKEKPGKNVVSEDVEALKAEMKLITQQKLELEKLYEKEKAFTVKLQNEIQEKEHELSSSMSELQQLKASGGGDADNPESELLQEIRMLKFEKDDLAEERNKLEREKRTLLKDFESNSVNLQIQFNEAKEQLKNFESTNEALRKRLASVEESLATKTEEVLELESKYNEIANRTKIKQIQNELIQLRENDLDKKSEIQSLKMKLNKCRQETKQREEEIKLHQRVLKVRSELMDCLEEGGIPSNETKISDLYSEVMQQSSYICKVNTELESKAEELQRLLSSLGTKQSDMNRQENLIKLLEQSKAKSQEIQDAQADRIEQLEKDVRKLKDYIRASEEANESKYHYSSRHCRKMSVGNDSESEKNRKRKYEK